ncbi:MAG: helix-turn-helix domain-containing protein [Aminipila sp.]
MKNYHEIIAEVRKQMYLRGWKISDLANATGYTPGTMTVMLNTEKKMSKKALNKICNVLKIKLD